MKALARPKAKFLISLTIGEDEMRTEKQIYEMILNFAKTDERIRMVTLEGSRTNINILPDDFQDYDITFLYQICRALSVMMDGLIYSVKG